MSKAEAIWPRKITSSFDIPCSIFDIFQGARQVYVLELPNAEELAKHLQIGKSILWIHRLFTEKVGWVSRAVRKKREHENADFYFDLHPVSPVKLTVFGRLC
jgi:hypothetical protein